MTEIFTTPPSPGQPQTPNGKNPLDKKLNLLIGGAAVFLVIALGVLGWVLLKGNDDSSAVATAQDNESAKDRDTDTSKGTDQDEVENDDGPDEKPRNDQVTLPASDSTPPTTAEGGGVDAGASGGSARTGGSTGSGGSGGTSPVAPMDVTVSNERDSVPLRCTGERMGYYGTQLIDGDLQTGWGASKTDGTDQSAVFNFGGSKQITTVGITPGYLRVAERNDQGCAVVPAFPYNRFVQSVRWEFDDGTSVVQDFEQRGEMQRKEVNKQTSSIRMVILSTVRPPGADDDTVISEAEFTGTP